MLKTPRCHLPVTVLVVLFITVGWAGSGWSSSRGGSGRPVLEGVVNINTAATDELQMLPGVGPSKAAKIVEYRQRRAFHTVEELGRVKGIGPKTVKKLRPHLTIRGATTAQRLVRPRGEPDAVSAESGPKKAAAPAHPADASAAEPPAGDGGR